MKNSPLNKEIQAKAYMVGCDATWTKGMFGYAWHCYCSDGFHMVDSQCSMITMESLSRKRPKPKPEYRKFEVRAMWTVEGQTFEITHIINLPEGAYLGNHGSMSEEYGIRNYISKYFSPELDITYTEVE